MKRSLLTLPEFFVQNFLLEFSYDASLKRALLSYPLYIPYTYILSSLCFAIYYSITYERLIVDYKHIALSLVAHFFFLFLYAAIGWFLKKRSKLKKKMELLLLEAFGSSFKPKGFIRGGLFFFLLHSKTTLYHKNLCSFYEAVKMVEEDAKELGVYGS